MVLLVSTQLLVRFLRQLSQSQGIDTDLAITTIAVPVAALLTYFDVLGRMTTTFFAHRIDAAIERFDYKGIERNYLLGAVPWALSRALPVFFALAFGGEFVQGVVNLVKNTNGCRRFDSCRSYASRSWICYLASLPSS